MDVEMVYGIENLPTLDAFEFWFYKIALLYLKKKYNKKILLDDNLTSHVSLKIISECEKYSIFFLYSFLKIDTCLTFGYGLFS